jgi:hypothetical protein
MRIIRSPAAWPRLVLLAVLIVLVAGTVVLTFRWSARGTIGGHIEPFGAPRQTQPIVFKEESSAIATQRIQNSLVASGTRNPTFEDRLFLLLMGELRPYGSQLSGHCYRVGCYIEVRSGDQLSAMKVKASIRTTLQGRSTDSLVSDFVVLGSNAPSTVVTVFLLPQGSSLADGTR